MTKKKEPTPRQIDTLHAIIALNKKQGFPPTIVEIAAHLNLKSTGAVRGFLTGLVEKGFISRNRNDPRSIRVLKTA